MKNLKMTSGMVSLLLVLSLSACKSSSDQSNPPSDPDSVSDKQSDELKYPNGKHYGDTFYKGRLENHEGHLHPLVRTRDEAHTSHISLVEPASAEFDADGFFQLQGYSINPNKKTAEVNHDYVLVEVKKVVDKTVDTAEYKPIHYFLRSDFDENIWLRYGKGEYIINVYALESVVVDLYGEGDIRSFRREKGDEEYESYDHDDHDNHHHGGYVEPVEVSYGNDHDNHDHHDHAGHSHEPVDTRHEKPPLFSITVNNVRDEDGRFYYPSQHVQSDSDVIRNKALDLTKNATSTAEKVQALHTFVIDHLSYDEASLRPAERKIQDALSALNNGVAVCEGYTSLMAALTRSIGIKTKVIAGFAGNPGYDKGAHAWVKVLVDGQWKFIDPTMNDDYNSHDLQDILLDALPETHELHPENPERPDV